MLQITYSFKVTYNDNGIASTAREVATDESAGSTRTGSRLSFEYESSEKTTVTYSGNDGEINGIDDIQNIYLFDNWGRCVNIHTIDTATDTVVGSSAVEYTVTEVPTEKTANRIKVATTIGVQPVNLLKNSGVETLYPDDPSLKIASWFYRPSPDHLDTVARTEAVAHTGVASMMVSAATASDTATYTSYIIKGLTAGAKYTFSAYAKGTGITPNTTSGGYYLYVGDDCSAVINKSLSESCDNGWVKLSVTFTATAEEKMYLRAGIKNASGTVYFDDFQLVKNSEPAQISLIPDGGLDNDSYFTTNTGAS